MTCGAFAALMHDPVSTEEPSMPVSCISFTDAEAWCAKAGLTLSTAAQWEFACVAGAATRFCWGDDTTRLLDHAWIRENSDDRPHPVAQKSWNAFGISDMHGNVREWCCGDAADSQGRRVAHGQGFDAGASSFRRVRLPDDESGQTGFRPAFTIPAEALVN
jgi:formylglycine-generating enzyme required for sulfatase activity